MKNILTSSLFIATFALTACGGGGSSSGSNDSSKNNKNETKINVAATANGATITPAEAVTLIDESSESTSWTATHDQPIIIDFGSIKNVESFELKRAPASATVGTNPDIKIELSTNGSSYTVSNVSSLSGGAPCSTMKANPTSMFCEMTPATKVRYVRITIAEDKSYNLTIFTALSY